MASEDSETIHPGCVPQLCPAQEDLIRSEGYLLWSAVLSDKFQSPLISI